jgi:hypothetical protein|tara:strand:+ start:65 stop:460 length:396 start_codon:yes stop_codon:yes gene_type:complete
MALPLLAGPALATAGRYFVTNGVKKGLQKYGPEALKQVQKTQGLKTVGDKVIKKRMTAAERKKTAVKTKEYKGMTKKEEAANNKQYDRIDKVESENMAAAMGTGKLKPMYNGGKVSYAKGGNVEMPVCKPN